MKKLSVYFMIVVMLGAGLPGVVHADSLAILGFGGTLTGLTSRTNPTELNGSGATVGWKFNIAKTIDVTALGILDLNTPDTTSSLGFGDGLNYAHQVGLWSSAGNLLASTTVAQGTAATFLYHFRYESLTTPLTLDPGDYYVGALYLSGYDSNANWVGPSPDGLLIPQTAIMADGISFLGYAMATPYSLDLSFPSRLLEEYAFGPSFMFADGTTTPVPEPTTMLLLGLGLLGLAGVRRKLKK